MGVTSAARRFALSHDEIIDTLRRTESARSLLLGSRASDEM
jgi:hypothetical protein